MSHRKPLLPLLLSLWIISSGMTLPIPVSAGPPGVIPPTSRTLNDAETKEELRRVVVANIGNLGMQVSQLGYFGNLLTPTRTTPSLEYPLNSKVEHMFVGGVWVGAINALGDTLVSVGADDTSAGSSIPDTEFGFPLDEGIELISSNPLSPYYSTSALATQHFEFVMRDELGQGSSATDNPHVPLGLEVRTKVLAYAPNYADDFIIVDVTVENVGSQELSGLYLGWYNELSVGNTKVNIPGDESNGWNFYDDKNSFIAPGDYAVDPDAAIMHCHDADGDDGKAISWIGVRLLGVEGGARETLSYRQWRFGDAQRRYDKGKYGFMASGRIDRGNEGQGVNYDAEGNWTSLIAVGPWQSFFPGDTARFTLAYAAGPDSATMVRASQVAQKTFIDSFQLPVGPPSPILELSRSKNTVTIRWETGIDLPDTLYDPTLASPEYHRSEYTRNYDFQGYRIYRIEGAEITGDPFEQATLVAEFDRITWPDGTPDIWGFNTGLPPLTLDGRREFVDTDLRDGFPYWYSVTSYANRAPALGLDELESGFNENSQLVVPGSSPGGTLENPNRVGVYPNPYRGSAFFDERRPSGEPLELGRKIYFTNVPGKAILSIYNVSGTLVARFRHEDDTTGQVAWDILSEDTRAIAPGLYVFVVEDVRTGEVQRGKLVILK